MTKQKLRVGIIGGSVNDSWAKTTHIPAIDHLNNIELTAVATSNMESAEKSAETFGASHAFGHPKDLAECPDVDLVVVSINVQKHYDAVKDIISTQKPIYTEWPLGSNTEEALEMQESVETQKIPTAIGLQARQAPAVNYIKDLLAGGYVGKILSANLRVSLSGMGGTGNEANAYLFDREAGGNLFTIPGGHNIDAFTYMLGDFKELSAVTAQQYPEVELTDTDKVINKTVDDQIMVTGKLVNEAAATIHIQGGVNHQTGVTLEVFGDKGTIILNAPATIQFGTHQILGAKSSGEELQELTVPKKYYWTPTSLNDDSGMVLNVAQAYSQFAKDIKEGTSNIPNFEDAVKLHKFLDTVEKAARTGERQYLSY